VVATGSVQVYGGSVLIRKKFSVHQFSNEVVDWNGTLFQCVRELRRYLVDASKNQKGTHIAFGMCCGNGLRADGSAIAFIVNFLALR
jgi:fatty-acyl-CoA synthase